MPSYRTPNALRVSDLQLMPQPNDHLGPYILIQKLGSGQFGVVWKAQRRAGIAPPCAIKLPTDSDVKWEDVEKEARVWLHASGHPNVLPMIEANVYDEQIALVSEYAADGSLLDWLRQHGGKAPSVAQAIEMMSGILAGLEHLHRRNIIHRDLKPANILLQGDIPRLADFGLSRVLSSTQSTTPAGTLAYMSPEAFNGERSAQSDIWAAGVILYQLLTGRLPFPQRDMASLMNAIFMKLPEPLSPDLPEPLRSTVMRALEKTCERRYESAEEMRQALLRMNAAPIPQSVSPIQPIAGQPAQYIAPRDVEHTTSVTPVIRELKAVASNQPVTPPKNNSLREYATRWIQVAIVFLFFVGFMLLMSFTGKYIYRYFQQGNGELPQPETPAAGVTASLDPAVAVKNAAAATSAALASLKPEFPADDLVRALNLQIINFASGSNAIPRENEELLKKSAEAIKQAPAGTKLEVGGHTDNKGDAAGNEKLSANRAKAVMDYLVKAGVSKDALIAKGYGSTKPVASNDTDEGRFKNRRIEFSVVMSSKRYSDSKETFASPSADNLQLKIQVGNEAFRLKITVDTNPPAEGLLNPGDFREFTASNKIILNMGNTAGVTATVNGHPIKLPTKGNVVITKDNYQQFFQ